MPSRLATAPALRVTGGERLDGAAIAQAVSPAWQDELGDWLHDCAERMQNLLGSGQVDELKILSHQVRAAGGKWGCELIEQSASELELLCRTWSPEDQIAQAVEHLASLCRGMTCTAIPKSVRHGASGDQPRERLVLPRYMLTGRSRLLVVADGPADLEQIHLIVDLPEFELRTATSAQAARVALEGFLPDLVLLDQATLLAGGHEFLLTIRRRPSSRAAEVIAIVHDGMMRPSPPVSTPGPVTMSTDL